MAFDGVTVAALRNELDNELKELRLNKISQPEKDALLLTFKGRSTQKRLFLSASPTLPLVYLLDENRPAPMTAPNFCMVLRKHLTNATLLSVTQPGLERILRFEFLHPGDLGDLEKKVLIAELMGKHSNLIFCDEKGMIIDSIKHVSGAMSSLREVLPGRDYFVPTQTEKKNPCEASEEELKELLNSFPGNGSKAFLSGFEGISPLMAAEICFTAGVDSDMPLASLSPEEKDRLAKTFGTVFQKIKDRDFSMQIYYSNNTPKDFSCVPLTMFSDLASVSFPSVSKLLVRFYSEKELATRMQHKTADLRQILTTILERSTKKWDLQKKQLKGCDKKDACRLYGELLKAYAYEIPEGSSSYEALDWNTNETVTIPLDKDLSPMENAARYFTRYQKLKRTEEALSIELVKTEMENKHLQSILMSLKMAKAEEDLVPIRDEMVQSGYIKKRSAAKLQKKSKPLHFKTSDGFDLYVGKNNFQNDQLTFKLANGNDLWFHAKKMPGSHVVLRTGGKEPTDRSYEEAAACAAFYSDGRSSDKVEVDYVERKEVKKPNGAPPGFVVYYTNYSMAITPDISGLTEVIESN